MGFIVGCIDISPFQGWVFNVVPWLVAILTSLFSGFLSDHLISQGKRPLGFSPALPFHNAKQGPDGKKWVCWRGKGTGFVLLGDTRTSAPLQLPLGMHMHPSENRFCFCAFTLPSTPLAQAQSYLC